MSLMATQQGNTTANLELMKQYFNEKFFVLKSWPLCKDRELFNNSVFTFMEEHLNEDASLAWASEKQEFLTDKRNFTRMPTMVYRRLFSNKSVEWWKRRCNEGKIVGY